MSIEVIKQGILDTVQDHGRYGYQHWGINPGGAMDTAAMHISNILTGNDPGEPVIEMHFPAPELLFSSSALIAVSGGDFGACIGDISFSAGHAVLVKPGDVLRFVQHRTGSRVYLSVRGGMVTDEWLGSHSTHLKTGMGGMQGRALQKGDTIVLKQPYPVPAATRVLPWYAGMEYGHHNSSIRFIPGAEYHLLNEGSCDQLNHISFLIGRRSDRMGYRLQGAALACMQAHPIISSAVTRGTIQLLPDGQLIILMADHQTTGGYPRIGHVISADMPALSQMQPGQELHLHRTDLATAEELFHEQQLNLRQLQNACTLRLQEFFQE